MKKLFKLTSIVLTVLMIITSITAVNVFATVDDPRLTWGTGDGVAVDIGVSSDATTEISAEVAGTVASSFVAPSSDAKIVAGKQTNVMVMKLTMPKFSVGKTLDKYIMRFCFNGTKATNTWTFRKIPGTSTEGLTATGIQANAIANDSAAVQKFVYDGTAYDATIITVDVSSYAKECLAAGQDYFYVGLYVFGTNCAIYTSYENQDSTLRNAQGFNYTDVFPYGYYTEKDAGALTFNSVTNPESTNDGVEFVFSNPINASTVTPEDFTVTDFTGSTVPVTAEDISVDGNKVTLTKDWSAYTPYTVSLSGIADSYGQTLTSACSTQFELSVEETTTVVLPSSPLKLVCGNNQTSCSTHNGVEGTYTTPTTDGINNKYHYALFQFDLSSIPVGKSVVDATFKYYDNYGRTHYVYNVPNYEWTTDSGTDVAYYESLKDACAHSLDSPWGNPNRLQLSVTTTTPYAVSVDVKSVISDIMSSSTSSKKVTLAYAFPGGTGSSLYLTNHATYPSTLTVTLADASFDAIEATPAKGGAMSGIKSPVEVTLATTIPEENATTANIQLVNATTGIAADVAIAANGTKLTITPNANLAENTRYNLVLKQGLKDAYNNELAADKVIHSFTTGVAFGFEPIKFTSELAPVYADAAEIANYTADGSVTAVTVVKNGADTTLPALMIIALYNSDNELVSIEFADTFDTEAGKTTQFSGNITIPEDVVGTYVKAFVWTDRNADITPVVASARINQQ